jgi:predicted lipoprotein with Yx(FWY)xxD motif
VGGVFWGMTTHRLLPLAVAAGALALAGCGSSSSDGGTTATAASKSAQTISTRQTDLGDILVDSQGRTLYLWKADTGTDSTCDGACAKAWPPVLTDGAPVAGDGVNAEWLHTTKRADGSTEVTYGGHPLYTFVQDTKPGDTKGQGSDGFGAEWLVVGGDGQPIAATSGGGGGGAGY